MSNNYLNYVTKRRVLIAIACGWMFAAINTAPIVLAWLEVEYDANRFVCVCFDGTFPLHYTLGPVFIGHFLPHAVTVTCYVIILRAVGRSRNRIQNSKTSNTNQSSVAFASDAENKGVRSATIDIPSNSMAHGERADSSRKETGGGGGLSVKHWSKHEMQMFRTSVWIIAFFSFCWIPYGILVLLQHLAPIALKKTFASLCLLSFSLNPLIYGVLSKSFRRAYARMLRKVFFCSPRHVTSRATSSSHRLSAIPQHARHA